VGCGETGGGQKGVDPIDNGRVGHLWDFYGPVSANMSTLYLLFGDRSTFQSQNHYPFYLNLYQYQFLLVVFLLLK